MAFSLELLMYLTCFGEKLMIYCFDFLNKRINSCEDPSRYNVKRLYIYANDNQ